MPTLRIIGSALLVTLLAACATPRSQFPEIDAGLAAAEAAKQREFVLKDWLAEQNRLNRVSYPLLAGGAPFCGDRLRPSIGVVATNSQSFASEFRTAAAAILGGGDSLRIVQVVDGFPGAEAGLEVGDRLLSIDGVAAPYGEDALKAWSETMDNVMDDADPIEMTVLRDGTERTVRMVPRMICDYPVRVHPDAKAGAFADGETLIVTKGMLRFARRDQELALVLAHELAHNAMGHIEAKTSNQLAGGLGGLMLDMLAAAAGAGTGGAFTKAGGQAGYFAHSVEFEKEADYVGLYIMANAGLDIDGAADFWRRMATLSPAAIEVAETHPTSPARFLAIEKAIAEVKAKQAAGLPLTPEMRPE